MPETDAEFLKRLLATFRVEAEEHVSALFSGLLELEKASEENRQAIVETVFREAHSLKGAARSVNLTEIEAVCARLESTFALLKRNEITLSPELLDSLHQKLDAVRSLLEIAASNSAEEKESASRQPEKILPPEPRGIISPEPEKVKSEAGSLSGPPESREEKTETVRISTARLDALLLQAEELLSAKLAANQHAEGIRAINSAFTQWRKEWARISPHLRSSQRSRKQEIGTDDSGRSVEFLEWNESFVESLQTDFIELQKSLEGSRRALAGMVDGLLADMKKTAMLPFSSILILLQKLARDLSREQGKLVNLVVQGGELEMDRRILEDLKDPLIHLVRNSIDHGIEKPAARERSKKSAHGTITISAVQRDARVEITVADDGGGINVAKVREAAISNELVSAGEAAELNDTEAAFFVFRSGVSTSPMLTDISGRGLGLAIVQEKVEQLGGTVRIQTQPGTGTTFHMLLPLTLSTFRGVVLRLGNRVFVLPTNHIERVLHFRNEAVKTVENRETLSMNGQTVPMVDLGLLLGIARPNENIEDPRTALVIASAGKRIAFVVGAVLQEQEIVLKNLGKQLPRVRNIAGSTILGGGMVVPVLNVSDLIRSAVRSTGPTASLAAAPPRKKSKPSVLVVDDSITSRSLLKNILETNGYQVETAVDGVDAFTKIRTAQFGLVVSDIEMPRMDGFDLTRKIREDKKFADLPVVLVTALESREDRERGIDVGANAYIVKSSFDQSNLLEVIGRLI